MTLRRFCFVFRLLILKHICINYVLLSNRLLQTWQLETVHIYYLIVSVGQKSRRGFARTPVKAVIKVWPELQSHLKVKDLFLRSC